MADMAPVPVEVHVYVHHTDTPTPDPGPGVKSSTEQRYVLGVAYQPGKDDRITTGADGGRDYFTEAELEKAAWSLLDGEPTVGLQHADGTEGAARIVESYILRTDWNVTDTDGTSVVVKAGSWLVGAILTPESWDMYKAGRITGWSPQGTGRRIRSTR